MAVGFDVASESHTGTSGASGASSFTWNHAGGASARGALVFVFGVVTNALPPVSSVTYGGATMTAIPYTAIDTDTEPGSVRAYYLDNCGTGTKAVVINRSDATPWAHVLYAVCFTVTAAMATEVYNAGVKTQAGSAAAQTAASSSSTGTCTNHGLMSIDDGSPGTNSLRFMGRYQGTSNVTAAGTGSTAGPSIDFGLYVCETFYESAAGQGARNVGGANVSDDLAVIALAVRENNHNASVVNTGGGVTAAPATGAHKPSVTAAAGGVAVVTDKGAHNATIASTGGGTVGAAVRRGATSSLFDWIVSDVDGAQLTSDDTSDPVWLDGTWPPTGGGAAVVTGVAVAVDNRNASVAGAGGGAAALAGAGAHKPSAVAADGGVAAPGARTQRTAAAVATGAGAGTVARTTARSATGAATGGGAATLASRSARVLAAGLAGGGVLTYVDTTARATSTSATGGGAAVVDGVKQIATVNRNATVTSTGAGAASLASSTQRAVAAAATAGGQATASILSARQLAVAMAGAGMAAPDAHSARQAAADATGGGVLAVDAFAAAALGLAAHVRITDAGAGAPETIGAPRALVTQATDAPVIRSARFIP